MSHHYITPTNLIHAKSEFLLEIKKNDILLTKLSSLKIFFQAYSAALDGTFKTIPHFYNFEKKKIKPHAQVYKIFAQYIYNTKIKNIKVTKNYFIGLALLSHKEEENYNWLFDKIVQWGKQFNLINNHKLKQFICDYEKATRNSLDKRIKNVLNIVIAGEYFHFNKAILNIMIKD